MPTIHDVFRHVSPRFRTARMQAFHREFAITPATRVLDIGGTFDNWELLPPESRPSLTLLNLGPRPADLPDEVSWSQSNALALPFGPGEFDLIFSNSLLHHLEDPLVLWRSVQRWSHAQTRVFVMDLMRPGSVAEARHLVDQYSAGDPEVLRRDFYNSLLASYRADEVQAQLEQASLDRLRLRVVSDRHWLVAG